MQYPRSHAHALYLAAHLALAACVLLVVICCGTPVTPSIAFVKLKALGRELVVGPWGWCFDGECSDPVIGVYELDGLDTAGEVLDFFGVDTSWADLADALVNTLTGAMVLHIILACLLFVLFVVLILHARSHAAVNKGGAPSHVSRLVVLVLLPLTLLVATVILAIDLAFAVIMRDRVSDIFDDWDEDGDDLSASLSHAIWLMVAAYALVLLDTLLVFVSSILTRRKRVANLPPSEK